MPDRELLELLRDDMALAKSFAHGEVRDKDCVLTLLRFLNEWQQAIRDQLTPEEKPCTN